MTYPAPGQPLFLPRSSLTYLFPNFLIWTRQLQQKSHKELVGEILERLVCARKGKSHLDILNEPQLASSIGDGGGHRGVGGGDAGE